MNIVDRCLVIIARAESFTLSPVNGILEALAIQGRAQICVSPPISDLTQLQHYYRQAVFATERMRGLFPSESVIRASDCMISYILHASDPEDMRYACHPDVRNLAELDRQSEYAGNLQLLRAYLDNERNISGTAKALYMHRNTLVYRLEKLQGLLTADLNDPYQRDYLKLSIYIIQEMQ